VTKAELGTKRVCPNCGTKYYDLHKRPILCPKCGTVFEVVATRSRSAAPVKAPPPVPAEEEVAPEAADLVPLEEADEEAEGGGKVKTDGEEAEEGEAEDDTFLEEEEEDGEDVGDIIGDVDEEER
jgi:uncharacterized protein (TIGR02300 family)